MWAADINGAVLSSPSVLESLVYVGSSDGRLYALERSTGAIAWAFRVGGMVWTSPAVVGGNIYFGSHDGFIYSISEAPTE